MKLQSNPELELAFEYICHTNTSVFLTGKAGTGKTTFLHRVRREVAKRMAVVAPTGVAAINAGGMTIHSLFQMPFGPYLPGNKRDAVRQRKFSREKIRLIRSLDLLIIDEISMVRADLLDGVDEVLRRYKNPLQPFGGVQLLMIGDLHQLPPVVKDEDWHLLRDYYRTPYFFGSQAWQKTGPVVVELKQIFRQSDLDFIRLLNKVRNNDLDADVMTTLNSRFTPNFRPADEEGYITLTTHNASARAINARKLEAIPRKTHTYHAEISGDFPAHAYPADEVLELKTGAQVMFVKNDTGHEKRYYNGKIGKITRIEEDEVYVQCPGDAEEIIVTPAEWANMKYSLDETTKEVTEDVIGTFTQHPLRLAWAITIHKSQGLTFERVILDAQAAFAHGQVYVALSRCKSFEGIVLSSRIGYSSVRTDETVKRFSKEAEENAPDETHLEQSKRAYQQSLILELFGFQLLKRHAGKMNRLLLEHEHNLQPGIVDEFRNLMEQAETGVFEVAKKFRAQLRHLFTQAGLPEENPPLQERLRKAAAWFSDKITADLQPAVKNLKVVTDNRKVRKAATEALEHIHRELFVKQACFVAARSGFATQDYLRTRAHAELDFQAPRPAPPVPAYQDAPQASVPTELYTRLRQWRQEIAEAEDLAPYQVLPARSLHELVRLRPHTTPQLKKVHGIGKRRLEKYGAALLDLVRDYCEKQGLEPAAELLQALEIITIKKPKPDTKLLSFQLLQSGKNLEEIAAERGLARSTIEGHLAHFIEQGELPVSDLIPAEDVKKIEAYFAGHPEALLSEAKARFGDAYSYGQLKMVMAHARRAGVGSD